MAIPLAGIGAILGGAGTLAGGLGSLFGGGSRSSSSSAPIDYYAQYGAQAAAANNPLTAAMQGLSVLQGSLGGALGLQGNAIASAQLSVLKEALDRAQKQTATQAGITTGAAGAGIDYLKQIGQAKLATELAGPQFLAQAGSSALAGENALAQSLASTNLGVRALEEQTRAAIAQKQADTLADVFSTRAKTEGALALGAQQLESGLKLKQAETISDLARLKGQTKSQLAIKQFGANQALAGTRYFA